MKSASLTDIAKRLLDHYGMPHPPAIRDPFELVLYENVSYLVDDEYRAKAFKNLRSTIGTRPEDILSAGPEQFSSVIEMAGSDKKGRVAKLISAAQIAMKEFDGDVRPALRLPFKQAVAALKKFPSIGEPGAENFSLLRHR